MSPGVSSPVLNLCQTPLVKFLTIGNTVQTSGAATASGAAGTRFQDALNICQLPIGKDFYHPVPGLTRFYRRRFNRASRPGKRREIYFEKIFG